MGFASQIQTSVTKKKEQAREIEAQNAEGDFHVTGDSDEARGTAAFRLAAREFLRIDRLLDTASKGPLWLKDERVAAVAVETLDFVSNQLALCEMHAYVVMANHVHALLSPKVPLARITKSVKGYSARKANVILQRTHEPFWQDESYDHWVRSEASFWKIVNYIENNPVSAGLVARPAEWRWSSATWKV